MITLAIPTYNRFEFVIESFKNVINNDVIDEICIVDDNSNYDIYEKLHNKIEEDKIINKAYGKIKIYRNQNNIGSFLNKLECVKLSKNNWIILLDSDNIIDNDYIDVIKDLKNTETIYAPSHAICESPILNYEKYSGVILDRENYKNTLIYGDGIWDAILNTGNYFFNKESYINCVTKETELIDSLASDVYYLVYLWFKNLENPKLNIVPNLKYIHRLHNESHYVKNGANSVNVINHLKNKIQNND
jgi:hypothetical protein